jgi:hypothetical protein
LCSRASAFGRSVHGAHFNTSNVHVNDIWFSRLRVAITARGIA